MSRFNHIRRQVETLLKISSMLKEEFNTSRGAVQFFSHKNRPELFVFQIREAHVVDVGKMLMSISFLVKMEYALLDGVTLKEKLNVPAEGHPSGQQYLNAFKHVYINIRLDPWLQHYIFSRAPAGTSPFHDVVRLPHVLQDFARHLPAELPPLRNDDLPVAISG